MGAAAMVANVVATTENALPLGDNLDSSLFLPQGFATGKVRKYVERTPTARAGQQQEQQQVFLALVRPPRIASPRPAPAGASGAVESKLMSMDALKLPLKVAKPVLVSKPAVETKPAPRKPVHHRKASSPGTMRVSFHQDALLKKPKGLRGGRVDLNVTGQTHRAYADSSSAVANRASPEAPVDLSTMTLALTHRSKDRWVADQQELTDMMASAYGDAGSGVRVGKGAGMQGEGVVADEVRKEFVPKVRKTVRAQQETMRLRKQVAANPVLRGMGKEEACEARQRLEARHAAALQKLQSAARGLSARREAKSRSMAFRGRTNCAQLLLRTASSGLRGPSCDERRLCV